MMPTGLLLGLSSVVISSVGMVGTGMVILTSLESVRTIGFNHNVRYSLLHLPPRLRQLSTGM